MRAHDFRATLVEPTGRSRARNGFPIRFYRRKIHGQHTPANKSRRTPDGEEKYRARIASATADAMRLPKRRENDTYVGV